MQVKILVADDHKVFREGIISLLQHIPELCVVAEAGTAEEAISETEKHHPNLVLMDITMGDSNGIEATEILKNNFPGLNVLVLTMHDEYSYISKVLKAGASGYILKDAGKDELISAIRAVASGNTFFSQRVSSSILRNLLPNEKIKQEKKGVALTKREIEILKLITEEYSNTQIAAKLFISARTVDTHRRNLLEKIGVKNTAGLVKYAIKHGIVEA